MAEVSTLGWVDFLVIALVLCISTGIGIYYRFSGGRQKTMEEYFMASQTMSIIPVGIALVVSFMSAITLLGVASENYMHGTQFLAINLSYLIGTPLVCYGFLPVFCKLKAMSVYEYLEKRFGTTARTVTSILNWLQLLLYSGVVLYAPSLALEATTGLSKTASIIVVGLVCAFYSTIGGIKAVLITDVFQALLMFVALFAVIGTAAYHVGGLNEIWRIAESGHRIEFDSISPDPTVRHTWWSLTIGGSVTFLSLYGVNQVQVQRMLSVRNIKAAQTALWLQWPILTFLSLCTCFSGLAIYSKYYNCDPLLQGRISSPDMLMPLYVMDTMSQIPGLGGLFIAGIFSAGLSTISATENSLAAVTLEDYVKPLYKRCIGRELSPSTATFIAKLLALTLGLASIALAFLAQVLGGILQLGLTIFGVVGGTLLGIFTLGMSSEVPTEGGAVTGMLTGLAFVAWTACGQPRPLPAKLPTTIVGCYNNTVVNMTMLEDLTQVKQTEDSSYFYLYRISYMWYGVIGFVITYAIGYSVSVLSRFLSKEKLVEQDPNLFFPFVAKRMRRKQKINIEANRDVKMNDVLQTKYMFRMNDNASYDKGSTDM